MPFFAFLFVSHLNSELVFPILIRDEGRVGHNGLVLDAGKNNAGTASCVGLV